MSRRRRRVGKTVGALEREDLTNLVQPVTVKFLMMLETLAPRLAPPAMTSLRLLRTVPRSYIRQLGLVWRLAEQPIESIPILSPVWMQHLIDEVVERKIDLRGTPLTYLLDPHPSESPDESMERFVKGVEEYLVEAAETFGGYRRNWTDNPDAVYIYEQVQKYTLPQLLQEDVRVSFPRTLGSFKGTDWKRWYDEGVEEGIDPDVAYLAMRAALYVHDIGSFAGALMGIVRSGMTENGDPEALKDPQVFGAAIQRQLNEAIRTLSGEIPDDDPLRIAGLEGARLRRAFEEARLQAGMSSPQANKAAARVIEASGEDQRNPAVAWMSIGGDEGPTDLDLAQRAYLWEHRISGSNLVTDVWTAITGDYDWPEWMEE